MNYAVWENYQAYYGSITDQSDFDKLNYRVSRLLDSLTGNRAKDATGIKADRLADCACVLIDTIADLDKSGAGRGISSVSNDGYTETYTATDPAATNAILRQTAFQALSGTGLMGAI